MRRREEEGRIVDPFALLRKALRRGLTRWKRGGGAQRPAPADLSRLTPRETSPSCRVGRRGYYVAAISQCGGLLSAPSAGDVLAGRDPRAGGSA